MFLRRFIKRPSGTCTQQFHTTVDLMKEGKYLARQATMLKKLMTGSNRSRSKFYTVDQTPSKQFTELKFLDPTSPAKKKTVSNRAKRRVKVLNVLFVEQITSMLSTGEVGGDILDMGLEITAVKVAPDFERINVFWQPTGTEKDEVFESLLPRVAGHLRHELSQLRVIGIVPPIFFVKDPFQDRISQVELALAKCDFGPDFTPTNVGDVVKKMKPVPVNSRVSFPSELASQIAQMTENREKGTISETEDTAEQIEERTIRKDEDIILNQSLEEILEGPEMRNDILGLDRDDIMQKIKYAVRTKKLKATSDFSQDLGFESNSLEFPNPEIGVDEEDRTKGFIKYLEKKKRDKLKMLKLNSTLAAEKEFEDIQSIERWKEHQERMFAEIESSHSEALDDSVDYIDDDFNDDFKTRP